MAIFAFGSTRNPSESTLSSVNKKKTISIQNLLLRSILTERTYKLIKLRNINNKTLFVWPMRLNISFT